jgi:hypothetical protein
MKVSYRATSGGGYTSLFDETAVASGPVLERFAPQFSAVSQVEPLFGSEAQFSAARGNVRCALPLAVTVTYTTLALALAGIRTFAALLGVGKKWHFKVEQDTEVQYYPNAVVDSYAPALNGVTVIHQLAFNSDTVTATAP